MSLVDLWKSSKDQISEKHVQQIIGFAGNGQLKDDGNASSEFRNFLELIPSSILRKFTEECLAESFKDSGLALQDLVNQIGRRLGFNVIDGRYRGVKNEIGFDGLWRLPNGHTIVVEVKTTDAYRINLNTIAQYRKSLIGEGRFGTDDSSILIVVGRQDTGDLEAQTRGSRHAWDVRLVSVDSLLRLVELKEEMEDPSLLQRICQILAPKEFTRLDEILDILFFTAEDVKQEVSDISEPVVIPEKKSGKKFVPVAFHEECARLIQKRLGVDLLKRSKATFESSDKKTGIICAVSRERDIGGEKYIYWYAFHPHQKEFLEGKTGFIAFGCGSADDILLIPKIEFFKYLDGFNVTDNSGRFYWHIHILKKQNKYFLQQKSGLEDIDITRYKLANG